ncbi:Domain of uncharacterised function (DUF2825) [Klebsiella pneumoniae]|nr:Domain of uncharacterised function (DUF2825) [Klebsiella pneumoniae]
MGYRLPHARGGVSRWRAAGEKVDTSSPRTWGCFSRPDLFGLVSKVFPTHVGVFLKVSAKRSGSMRLPHARGGVSGCVIRQHELDLSSPRTWGCFRLRYPAARTGPVFPTHVGVFLTLEASLSATFCLPHARGGVSCEGSTSIGVLESSLHMWDLAISGILVLE